MKDSTRIFILSVFSAILIWMPILYENFAYHIHQRKETVSKVLEIKNADSNNFVGNVLDLKKRKKIDSTFHRRLEQHFPKARRVL